jgi:hypothetical protein
MCTYIASVRCIGSVCIFCRVYSFCLADGCSVTDVEIQSRRIETRERARARESEREREDLIIELLPVLGVIGLEVDEEGPVKEPGALHVYYYTQFHAT